MTLVGCDLHSRKQQVAVLDTTTGEVLEQELAHAGDVVERLYRALRPPVTIGIETTGYTRWFHALMHQLGHTVLVGEGAHRSHSSGRGDASYRDPTRARGHGRQHLCSPRGSPRAASVEGPFWSVSSPRFVLGSG
jgi:hypothetical protein